jgi:hypothetical protein
LFGWPFVSPLSAHDERVHKEESIAAMDTPRFE